MRDRWLAVTILTAVLVLVGTSTAVLTLDHRVNSADALRTGGLAAGSVVALYALWLNDRRRRVEERRQELDQHRQELDAERYALEQRRQDLEDQRTQQDEDRGADERFARAVELLGNEADQVRVGALHSLAGLARTHPDYTQTVLDVLCSYLRRPFRHPRYTAAEEQWSLEHSHDAEREMQVRLTAQRLLTQLLPSASDTEAPTYDLDLTRASVEYFDLSRSRVGRLYLRYAYLYSSTNLSGCVFVGPAWFTGVRSGSGPLAGVFRCTDTVFRDRAWFSGVELEGPAYFDRTSFLGRTKFSGSLFHDRVSMVDARFQGTVDLRDTTFLAEAALESITYEGEVLDMGLTINNRKATRPWNTSEDAAKNAGLSTD